MQQYGKFTKDQLDVAFEQHRKKKEVQTYGNTGFTKSSLDAAFDRFQAKKNKPETLGFLDDAAIDYLSNKFAGSVGTTKYTSKAEDQWLKAMGLPSFTNINKEYAKYSGYLNAKNLADTFNSAYLKQLTDAGLDVDETTAAKLYYELAADPKYGGLSGYFAKPVDETEYDDTPEGYFKRFADSNKTSDQYKISLSYRDPYNQYLEVAQKEKQQREQQIKSQGYTVEQVDNTLNALEEMEKKKTAGVNKWDHIVYDTKLTDEQKYAELRKLRIPERIASTLLAGYHEMANKAILPQSLVKTYGEIETPNASGYEKYDALINEISNKSQVTSDDAKRIRQAITELGTDPDAIRADEPIRRQYRDALSKLPQPDALGRISQGAASAFTGTVGGVVRAGETLAAAGASLISDNDIQSRLKNSVGSKLVDSSNQLNQNMMHGLNPTQQFFASTAVSIAQNLMTMMMTGGLGGAAALMGLQAGGRQAHDISQRGGSMGQQLVGGALAGAGEFAGERVSIKGLEKILKGTMPGLKGNIETWVKEASKKLGTQMATEAIEESATEAMNIAFDYLVMQDEAEMAKYFSDYIANNPDKGKVAAVLATAEKILEQVALSGAAGAISGGVFGGGALAINQAQSAPVRRSGASIMQNGLTDTLMQSASEMGIEVPQNPTDLDVGMLQVQYAQAETEDFAQKVQSLNAEDSLKSTATNLYKRLASDSVMRTESMVNLRSSVQAAAMAQTTIKQQYLAEVSRITGKLESQRSDVVNLAKQAANAVLSGNTQLVSKYYRASKAYKQAVASGKQDVAVQQAKAKEQSAKAVAVVEATIAKVRSVQQKGIANGREDSQNSVRAEGVRSGDRSTDVGIYREGAEGVRPAAAIEGTGQEDQRGISGTPQREQAGGSAGSNLRGSQGAAQQDLSGSEDSAESKRIFRGLTITPQSLAALEENAVEIARDFGIEQNIQLVNEVDSRLASVLDQVKELTGMDAFLYTADFDPGWGFTKDGMIFINVNANPKTMVHTYAHEAGHADKRIITAGRKVLEMIDASEVEAYRHYRNANISSPDNADVRSEMIADVYGQFIRMTMFGNKQEGLGLRPETLIRFYDAFLAATSAKESTELEGEIEYTPPTPNDGGMIERSRMDSFYEHSAEMKQAKEFEDARPLTREEGRRANIIDPANLKRYWQEIDGAFDGSLTSGKEIIMGMTPDILVAHGMPPLTVDMLQTTARKIAYPLGYFPGVKNDGKHNLGMSVLKQLPYQLADPEAIIVNPQTNKAGYRSVIVLTEWKDGKGAPVVVPIHIDVAFVGENRNHIASVFQADYIATLLGENNKNVVYTKNGKDINVILASGKQLPEVETEDVLGNNIPKFLKDVKEIERSRLSFPDPDGMPSDNAPWEEKNVYQHTYHMPTIHERTNRAIKQYGGARYYADFTLDGKKRRVTSNDRAELEAGIMRLKQAERMKNLPRPVQIKRDAWLMYRENMTVQDYFAQQQAEGKPYDLAIARALTGIMLDNGKSVGGKLTHQELTDITQNAPSWKVKSIFGTAKAIRITLTAPQRIFRTLGSWRSGKDSRSLAENYLEGERLVDTFYYPVMEANANVSEYTKRESEPVMEVLEGLEKRDRQAASVLAQLLGEQLITERDLKNAIFDSNGLYVKSAVAEYVFDRQGRLLAVVSDGILARPEPGFLSRVTSKLFNNNYTANLEKGTLSLNRVGMGIEVRLKDGERLISVHSPRKVDAEGIKALTSALTAYYSRAHTEQNTVLTESGYVPMGYVENYFPHLGRNEDGIVGFVKLLQGESNLPTAIAGDTEHRTPGKPFVTHLLERIGDQTEFDAIRGFNRYLRSAADLIYFTPVIQRLRQLEQHLRQDSYKSQNAELTVWLKEYTNGLANKQAGMDRGWESMFGREVYGISNKLTGWFGGAAVLGNASTALSNNISLLTSLPSLEAKQIPKAYKRAFFDAWAEAFHGKESEFDAKFPILAARFGSYQDILTNPSKIAGSKLTNLLGGLFQFSDRMAIQTATLAKYGELMGQGFTEEEAVKQASLFAVDMFADRSKGMTPTLYGSKVLKPFAQFQLENQNFLSIFGDMIRNRVGEQVYAEIQKAGGVENLDWNNLVIKSGLDRKTLGRILMMLILLSMWGGITRRLMGRDQTWNPYGIIEDFVIDVQVNGVKDAVEGLGANIGEQLPFAQLFTDSGRVPVKGAVDNVIQGVSDLVGTGNTPKQRALGGLKAATSFLPGGAQISKTIRGFDALSQGAVYSNNGNYRYGVEPDLENIMKGLMFGPSALAPKGYDYQKDTFSTAATENMQDLMAAGINQKQAEAFLRMVKGNASKAETLAGIIESFSEEHYRLAAEVLGVDYKGNIFNAAKKAANEYIRSKRKDKDLDPEKLEQAELMYVRIIEQLSEMEQEKGAQ